MLLAVGGGGERKQRVWWATALLKCMFAQDNHNSAGGAPIFASRKAKSTDLS